VRTVIPRNDDESKRRLDEYVRDPVFRRLAAPMVTELPAICDQIVRRLIDSDSFYGEIDDATAKVVRADVEIHLGHIVRAFAGLEPLDFDHARELARRRAVEGVPVSAVLHAYRLGAQITWEFLSVHRTWDDHDFRVDQLLEAAAVLWALVNEFSEVISQVYDDTAAERFRRSERERTLLLDAILEGRTKDIPRMGEAARVLDLPEQAAFVVIDAENPATGSEGLTGIDRVLRAHGVRSAWRLRSQRHLGIVVCGPAPASLAKVSQIIEERAVGRVGVSPVYSSLVETAEHVSLADLARSCLSPGTVGVALFDDHPIGTLLARSPDLSQRIVELVLGPVLALEADERVALLDSLRVWIGEGGSTTKASERLYCHRNTIRNRLQRIESLTNRSLSDPTQLAEIRLAVNALALNGDGSVQ
jgi:hypothetical protein